jgi:hypothetical protein
MRETYGREVYYAIPDPNLKQATQWLTSNPNRINLGRIGLRYQGSTLKESLITEPTQELDLWDGTITSTFKVDGKDVKVVTQGDFESDAVAFAIESDLVRSGALQVEMDFPYPPIHTTTYKYEVSVCIHHDPQRRANDLSRSLLVCMTSHSTTPPPSSNMAQTVHPHTYNITCKKCSTLPTCGGRKRLLSN